MLVVTVTATATVMAKGKERVGSRSRDTRGTSRLGNRLSVGQWGFFLLGRGSGVGRTGYVLCTLGTMHKPASADSVRSMHVPFGIKKSGVAD